MDTILDRSWKSNTIKSHFIFCVVHIQVKNIYPQYSCFFYWDKKQFRISRQINFRIFKMAINNRKLLYDVYSIDVQKTKGRNFPNININITSVFGSSFYLSPRLLYPDNSFVRIAYQIEGKSPCLKIDILRQLVPLLRALFWYRS